MLRADRDRICAALRSNEYKQGEDRLERIINGVSYFCCLGVICDTFIPETRILKKDFCAYYNGVSAALPPNLIERLGVSSCFMNFNMPAWRGSEHNVSLGYDLAMLNDNAKLTFEQIADMLEYFFEVED
jgi:hypothetical protein